MPFVKMKRVGAVETPRPRYMREGDAGLDLFAAVRAGIVGRWSSGASTLFYPEDRTEGPVLRLPQGASAIIPTGWAMQIPPGYEGQVRGRSGCSESRLFVTTGTIDHTYRGEICFQVWNQTGGDFVLRTGDRLAQLVIAPVATVHVSEVEDLDPSPRGEAGYGSSGTSG